jgi:hypothetical protein
MELVENHKAKLFTFSYAPESLVLRPADEAALKTALGKIGDTDRVHAKIIAARGGAGNAFDQLMVARSRAQRINEMLPKHVVASIEFNPEMPDNTLRVEFAGGD